MRLAGITVSPAGQITRQPARPSVMTSTAPVARCNALSCSSGAVSSGTSSASARNASSSRSSPSQLTSATRWPSSASASATPGAQPPKRPSGSTAPSNFEVRPGEGGTLTCQAKVIAASPATTASNSVMGALVAQPSDGDVEIDDLSDVALDILERRLVEVGTVRAHRPSGDGRPEAIGERVLDARPDADVGLDAGDDHPFNALLL